ncbi:MAG: hypothetical protein HUK24_07375, partial [Sphaerochaetaceae bacterium]|nr:hypothetical protein [Sphaerochaetaceae bacterium]
MIIRKEDLESYLSQGFSEVASSKSHAFVEKDNYFKKWARDTRATIDSTFGADSRPSMVFLNGNPFTKGHLYLIDIARRRSSFVVVFVNNGQLDFGGHGNHEKSHIEFSFEDRFALIKEELRVYSNVLVLPSGPYFLSRLSFPDNVLDNKARVALSCSVLDSALFLDAIVPSLRLS